MGVDPYEYIVGAGLTSLPLKVRSQIAGSSKFQRGALWDVGYRFLKTLLAPLCVWHHTLTLLGATRFTVQRGVALLLGASTAALLLGVVERALSHRIECRRLLTFTQLAVSVDYGEVVVIKKVGGGVLAIHGRLIRRVVVGVRGIVELLTGDDTFFELDSLNGGRFQVSR